MSVISPKIVIDESGVMTATWGSMTTSDTGGPIATAGFTDITIQVLSSGSGTVQVQGSNDGTNYVSIGSAQDKTALVQLSVHPAYIQMGTVGVATSSVVLVGRKGGK